MQDLPNYALTAFIMLAALAASGHAVIYKREPRSAALWLIVIWVIPVAGALLYVLLGVNRVERRALKLRRRRRPGGGGASAEVARIPGTFAPLARLAHSVGGRPLVAGNAIEPLVDGAQAYPSMLAAIEAARSSVCLASYIFHSGGIGARFVDALVAAVRRGVEVRVLIDDVNARFSFSCAAPRLRRAGVPVGVFNPTLVPARLHAANLRNHRKILVADGALGFTGGMNVDRNHWREDGAEAYHDTHFRLRGPAVAQLVEVFAEDWHFSTDERLAGDKWFPPLQAAEEPGAMNARVIESGPDESIGRLRWTLLGALNAARRSVMVCTPYFLPDAGLISALNAAALRGVEVDILLPRRTDLPHVRWAMIGQLWQVLERGCRAWETPGAFDHSKLMVVDGEWTLFGSSNWDARSLRLNFELDVEAYGAPLGARVEELLRAKRATGRPLTLEELDARHLAMKLRDGLARLFTPYF
jgi:cardiolipin synthase